MGVSPLRRLFPYVLRYRRKFVLGLLCVVVTRAVALAGDFYGTKYLSTNYGLLLMAWGFAGVLGPLIGSRVFVATGSYQAAFFGAAVFALAALGLLFVVRPPAAPELVPART